MWLGGETKNTREWEVKADRGGVVMKWGGGVGGGGTQWYFCYL